MEEFKNDLIDLFKKHKIMALEGSVELHFSPLYDDGNIVTRDVLLKFSQLLNDSESINEHREKHGITYISDYFNIYKNDGY